MPEVIQTRGGTIESIHPWCARAVVSDRVIYAAGDDVVTTLRSSAKPFQLACSMELLGDPDVTEEELAIGAASHSAEPAHLALVRRLFERFDLTEADLRCGSHAPMHGPSAAAILREGGYFSVIHNNCSGKHAFMAAASRRVGAGPDYLPLEHPLQQLIFERLQAWTGYLPTTAVDGCGVPTFSMPVSALARAFSRLAVAMSDHAQSPSRLGQIGWAMARHPRLTAGTGRLDPFIVEGAREPVVAKIGAIGVFCVALPERRMGLAVKVASGCTEALPAAVAAALDAAAKGAWKEPTDWPLRQVENVVGRVVGDWQSRD